MKHALVINIEDKTENKIVLTKFKKALAGVKLGFFSQHMH